jgi:hypothetical protein
LEAFLLHSANITIFLLAISGLPVAAATVADRTGPVSSVSTFPIGGNSGDSSFAVGWTQAAGISYSGVMIAATLRSTDGLPASGTAYLTHSLGAGAANVVLPFGFTVPGSTQTAPTAVTLFAGLTLQPGSYYLTISNSSGNLAWAYVNGGGIENAGSGVTIASDLQDFSALSAYPPGSPTLDIPVTAGGSTHVLLFSATGTLGIPSVRALSDWTLFSLIVLLALSGSLAMSCHRLHLRV